MFTINFIPLPECRSLEGLVRVPVIGKLLREGGLELLAEQVDPPARELVEQKVEGKVLGNFDFHMHCRLVGTLWDSCGLFKTLWDSLGLLKTLLLLSNLQSAGVVLPLFQE